MACPNYNSETQTCGTCKIAAKLHPKYPAIRQGAYVQKHCLLGDDYEGKKAQKFCEEDMERSVEEWIGSHYVDKSTFEKMQTALYQSRFDVADTLSSYPAFDINGKDKDGWTLIALAASNGNFEAVKLLESKGAKIYDKDAFVQPIHAAILSGNIELIKFLHGKCNECIDAKDIAGRTPLHMAIATRKSVDFIKCLVKDLGADIYAKDNEGATPMILAASSGLVEHMKCLYNLASDKHKLLETTDGNGTTPIVWAVFMGEIDAMACLKELGANLKIKIGKETLIDFACDGGANLKHTRAEVQEWLRNNMS